jgi:hypothetical protein
MLAMRCRAGTADRKAVGSLASALEQVGHEARTRASDPGDLFHQLPTLLGADHDRRTAVGRFAGKQSVYGIFECMFAYG